MQGNRFCRYGILLILFYGLLLFVYAKWLVPERKQMQMQEKQESMSWSRTAPDEKDLLEKNRTQEVHPRVALTFDDGPHPVYTELLLDGLKKRGVHVTFFVLGEAAEKYPDIIRRMSEEGHLIGNHTYHHTKLTTANEKQFLEEIQKTNALLREITGKDTEYIRPPYGAWKKSYEKKLNMFPVLWNIDPLDWCSDDAGCITRNVIEKVEENSIILLHDQYETTITAAFRIIDALQEKGYAFVTVEELVLE